MEQVRFSTAGALLSTAILERSPRQCIGLGTAAEIESMNGNENVF